MSNITTFTQEELAYFAKKPSDHLHDMIAATGNETILAAFDQYASMRSNVDIGARTWLTSAMSELYRQAGPEPTQKALMDFFGPLYTNAAEFWEMNFHDRAAYAINNIRESLDSAVIVVDEDEEKLRFRMNPCETGQKLCAMGVYEGENGFAKCSAHLITGGREDFPVYCTHNPIMDLACIEACGYPNAVTEYPENMCSCSCTYVVYKDKDAIPEEYYTRINKMKP